MRLTQWRCWQTSVRRLSRTSSHQPTLRKEWWLLRVDLPLTGTMLGCLLACVPCILQSPHKRGAVSVLRCALEMPSVMVQLAPPTPSHREWLERRQTQSAEKTVNLRSDAGAEGKYFVLLWSVQPWPSRVILPLCHQRQVLNHTVRWRRLTWARSLQSAFSPALSSEVGFSVTCNPKNPMMPATLPTIYKIHGHSPTMCPCYCWECAASTQTLCARNDKLEGLARKQAVSTAGTGWSPQNI